MSAVMDLTPLDRQEPEPTRALANVATPAMLLQIAVERGADLAYVEKLMELQERFQKNEARNAYNAAFAAFKAEAVKIIKNRSVTAGPLNGKKYAELHSVVNAVTPALSRHGLSASWQLTKDEKDWLEVTCTIKHAAGHSESVAMGGPPDTGGAKNKIQERASTISYLSRYTLKAITGLAEQDDDDDGNGAPLSADQLLAGFRDAALGGTAALRAHYDKVLPPDDWWAANSKGLKAAAKQADEKGGAQ
jgi:hypothetical protein